jgi:hypothetical protein
MTTYIITGRLGINRATGTLRGAIPARVVDYILRPRYRVGHKLYPDRGAARKQQKRLQATYRRRYEIKIRKADPKVVAKWKPRLSLSKEEHILVPKFQKKGAVDFYTFGPGSKQGIKITKNLLRRKEK